MKQKELDARARADLYSQLATIERAGLPLGSLVKVIEGSAGRVLQPRLARFQRLVGAGSDVADAGSESSLFLPWESRLIQAATVSGKLDRVYRALARRYAERARRYTRIRSGMVLPLALMVVAVFLAPIAALFAGDISGRLYLLLTAGRLLLFFSALFLLSFSWRRLGAGGADNTIHRLLLRLPCFGGLIRRQQQRDFLHSLALLLEAGAAVFDALPTAAASISHPGLRHRFRRTEELVRKGASLTEALWEHGALPDAQSKNLLRSGEASGRTEDMVFHIVGQLDEWLDSRYQSIADWTPRVAYVLVFAFFVTVR